jgi:hypothetical protein
MTAEDLATLYPRLVARAAKHGIEMKHEYSIDETQVLIEKSPVWTRRMLKAGPNRPPILQGVKREMNLNGYKLSKWYISALSIENYLADDEENEHRRLAAREDPRGYYAAARRSYRRPSLNDMTPEQIQALINKLQEKLGR